jgi:DnaJ-class molecular chaperone
MADKKRESASSGKTKLNPGDQAEPGTPGAGENVCRECQGTGKIGPKECPICGGTGVVIEEIGGG